MSKWVKDDIFPSYVLIDTTVIMVGGLIFVVSFEIYNSSDED